eukprot:snap_masked-scaffold_29-processed-gene-3.3-mRNA-1 protein AED:1.00 eAED:1.00 QI:0/0/0/0/1/1/2/0/203
MKESLFKFYQEVNPKKVAEIDDILIKYKGYEKKLVQRLEKKYQRTFNQVFNQVSEEKKEEEKVTPKESSSSFFPDTDSKELHMNIPSQKAIIGKSEKEQIEGMTKPKKYCISFKLISNQVDDKIIALLIGFEKDDSEDCTLLRFQLDCGQNNVSKKTDILKSLSTTVCRRIEEENMTGIFYPISFPDFSIFLKRFLEQVDYAV